MADKLKEAEYSGEDILSLAKKAVRKGFIRDYILDHLTSLHPQVPVSMALRYLKEQCYLFGKVSDRKYIDGLLQDAIGRDGTAGMELQLGLEHASRLIEILVKYASKWRLIGTALRFHYQDLDNIQASHASMVDSLKLNLIRLIEDWLQRTHPYTLPPTRSCLVEALRSSTVELGDVACELVTKELTSLHGHSVAPVAGHALPYSIIEVNEDLKSARVTTEVVYTEENKSVLLEVQNKTKLATSYQWLKNEQWMKDEQYSGSTSCILYIATDIDMDGCNFSCRIQDGSSHLTTAPITLKVSCPLDKHRESLASMYLAQPEVPEDTWPPQASKTYVNLAIIKQDKRLNYRSKYTRETIRNDMDDVFQQKEKIEYSDVLNSLKSGQVLFVEGRPGCGKTTFVNKITQDWTGAHDGPIRLVLLVSLRILNLLYLQRPTIDLSDLIQLFDKLKLSKEAVEEREGKGVCFIFDGLDEFSPRDGEGSIVFRIIRKSYLKQSTVIVASRPAAIAKCRSKANKIIEVLGFLKEQILEYFDSYPFSEELKSAELREYLLSHPNIAHMCYLPIHAAMVAYLYEVTGEIPRTETEIYEHFTRFTLTRSLSKKVNIEKIDVSNLSGKDKKLFHQICELALDKTVHNKQVLQQDEVRASFKTEQDGDISLGLITIDRIAGLYNYENIYTFLHLTFQEYLAAYHISMLTDEEQLELIDRHGDKVHMLVVWKFYCGLMKLDSTGGMFRAVMRKTLGATLHKIQCAYESQQPVACDLVLESADSALCFKNQYLTTPDFTALGYVLSNASPITLSLIHCSFNVSGIDAFLSETGNKPCLLQTLKYSSDSLDEVMQGCLEKLLPFLGSLQCLDLSCSNATTQYSLETISSTLARSCSSLRELSVSNIPIGPSNVLSECKQLAKLTLTNIVGEAEFVMLAATLRTCTSLENVKISHDMTRFSCDITQIFELCTDFQGVRLKISIEQVDLSLSCHSQLKRMTNSVNEDGITSNAVILDDTGSGCAEGIKFIRGLENLTVSNCHVKSKVKLLKLINNLDQQVSLKILRLEEANLDAAGAIAISSSLKHCTALTTLNLRGNRIGKEGAQALSSGFQYWPNLQVLNLDGCTTYTNIGLDGAVVLSEKLQLCPHLSELYLRKNSITDAVRLLLKKQCCAGLCLDCDPVVKDELKDEREAEPKQQAEPELSTKQCCIIL